MQDGKRVPAWMMHMHRKQLLGLLTFPLLLVVVLVSGALFVSEIAVLERQHRSVKDWRRQVVLHLC